MDDKDLFKIKSYLGKPKPLSVCAGCKYPAGVSLSSGCSDPAPSPESSSCSECRAIDQKSDAACYPEQKKLNTEHILQQKNRER